MTCKLLLPIVSLLLLLGCQEPPEKCLRIKQVLCAGESCRFEAETGERGYSTIALTGDCVCIWPRYTKYQVWDQGCTAEGAVLDSGPSKK
jgi:hypothetical protein